MMDNILKPGSTRLLVIEWPMDIETVESVIFTLVGNETLQLRYPEVVAFDNNFFLIPLTQEDTLKLSTQDEGTTVMCEGQVNFKDKSVAKSNIAFFYFSRTLATEIVDGNAPSRYPIGELHFEYIDGIIVAQVDPEALSKQIAEGISQYVDKMEAEIADMQQALAKLTVMPKSEIITLWQKKGADSDELY